MKTTAALETAVQALLEEHQKTDLPGDAYMDVAIDIAGFRGDSENPAMLQTLIDNTVALLGELRTVHLAHTRAFEAAERAVEATRNELRGPVVSQMADALLAAIKANDPSAMADDIVVNDVRTFAIDAVIDAETVARLLLEAAERLTK